MTSFYLRAAFVFVLTFTNKIERTHVPPEFFWFLLGVFLHKKLKGVKSDHFGLKSSDTRVLVFFCHF